MKAKYGEKAKLCYMDTDTFIVYLKPEDVTPNYQSDRPLCKEKNKKVIGLRKDELGGKIMREFAALKTKT